MRAFRPVLPILIAVAWGAALLAKPVPAVRAQGPESAPQSLDRDALWRSIFARPKLADLGEPAGAARIALGQRLFNDPRLSGSGTRACSTCHRPDLAFTDGLARAAGADGKPLARNTPHLWNLGEAKSFYWDGRMASLEEQAVIPITTQNELGGEFALIGSALSADPKMAEAFRAAFPENPEISDLNIASALAAYERSLVSPPGRFDSWVAGDDAALTGIERDGFAIFTGKGGCVSCHGGWRFTDDAFHDIGLRSADPGRGAVAGGAPGIPAFKTPGLRDVARTAPYMHDGSLATLKDVVDHYSGGMSQRASLSPNLIRNLNLNASEKAALIAFLHALTSNQAESPAAHKSTK